MPVGTPDTRTSEEKGILSQEEIRRREKELKEKMLQTGALAGAGALRGVAEAAGSTLITSQADLASAGALAEQANIEAQEKAFPGRGIASEETDPLTGEVSTVRTGATPEVIIPSLSEDKLSPDNALLKLRETRLAREPTEAQVQSNRLTLAGRAGIFIKPPQDVGSTGKLNAKRERLIAFERNQNLRRGRVGVETVQDDITGLTGRRFRKGVAPSVVLSPVEVENVVERVNTLIDNPNTGTPITEEEFNGVESLLAGSKEGNEFLRVRRNEEIAATSDIEKNIPLFKSTKDVVAFLEKYKDNNIITSYVESQMAEVISDKSIQAKLRLGDKDVAKADLLIARTSQEILGNTSRFKKFLLQEKGYKTAKEVDDIINSAKSGDRTATNIYNEFKSSEDHIQVDKESGQPKLVETTSTAKKKQKEQREIESTVISKSYDTKDPKIQKTMIDNGATQIDIDIVNNTEELKEKYKLPDKMTLAQIPQNINTTTLARQARQLMISDRVSAETAINNITEDIDANEPGRQMVKSQVAKDLTNIAKANNDLVSDSMNLDREEAIADVRIHVSKVVDDWPSDNATNPAFSGIIEDIGIKGYLLGKSIPGKPNYVPGALGPLDEQAYEYVERGLSLAEDASADAKKYGSIKDAFDMVRTAAATSSLQAQEIAKKKQIDDAIDTETRNTITKSNLDNGRVTFWEQNEDGSWSDQAFVRDAEGVAAFKLYQTASTEDRKSIAANESKRRQDKAQLVSSADGDVSRLRSGNVGIVRYITPQGSDTQIRDVSYEPPKSEQDWDSYAQSLKNEYGGDPEVYSSVLNEFNASKKKWNETVVKDFLNNESVTNLSQNDMDVVVNFLNEATEEWSATIDADLRFSAPGLFNTRDKKQTARKDAFDAIKGKFGEAREKKEGVTPKQQLRSDSEFTVDAPPSKEQFQVENGFTLMYEQNQDGTLRIETIRDDLVQKGVDIGLVVL